MGYLLIGRFRFDFGFCGLVDCVEFGCGLVCLRLVALFMFIRIFFFIMLLLCIVSIGWVLGYLPTVCSFGVFELMLFGCLPVCGNFGWN